MVSKDSKIVIVGSGTFGCSTALHLARQGYTNVLCLDKYPVPSPISAGNDINKIVDIVEDPVEDAPDERLQKEAVELWRKDPVFSPYFHEVGVIVSALHDEPLEDMHRLNERRKKQGMAPLKYLSNPEDFRQEIPALTGPLSNWKGYKLGSEGGWVHARKALESAASEAEKLGVRFQSGADGDVKGLKIENGVCVGVETHSGKTVYADKVVLSAGANTVLLTDFKGQLEAKCFTLAHIKLTPEENAKLKDTPVMFNYEKGFFFEADEDRSEMKICNEFPGYTNLNKDGESVPIARHEIPLEAEQGVRDYLRETIPEFADKELVKARICWCTDSPDRNLILTTHPDHDNVVLATGDSGRSYVLIPVVGKYIAKVATDGTHALSEQDRHQWRWRPETASSRDDQQGRWGGSGKVSDIKDIHDWTNINWDKQSQL